MKNKGVPEGGKLVSIEDVATEFWKTYGRNFFRWGKWAGWEGCRVSIGWVWGFIELRVYGLVGFKLKVAGYLYAP